MSTSAAGKTGREETAGNHSFRPKHNAGKQGTGDLRWITKLDPDPHAIITGSPVLADNTIFVGTSQAGTSTYPGALVALNPRPGEILWRTYSLPNPDGLPGGYWGAVMFGPPAVDLQEGLVFATFKVAQGEPTTVKACNAAAPGGFSESCEQPGSYLSSILAFDLKTGAPVWSYRVVGETPCQRVCGSQPPSATWCAPESDNPLNGGDKWDLGGSGPNVFEIFADQLGLQSYRSSSDACWN